MKKLVALLLAVLMVFGLMTTAFAAEGELAGKTVILHTNDVHGAVGLYAKVAALKKDYQAKGADVILVDAGDYIQGEPYVSDSQGKTAIELMNAAGYDVATFGNHEFDYGYANLQTIAKDAKFKMIGNIRYNGKLAFDATYVVETAGGLKIGFLGLTTPETATKAHPAKIKNVTFMANDELYSFATQEAADLKANGNDLVIALTHLGVDPESEPNRSTDLYANAKGIDFIIDGHSHTVMTEGENKEPIQSTGTKLENIGVIVIDNATKKIERNELVKVADLKDEDADTKAAADAIIADVDARLGAVFAKSEVELNGKKAPQGNRDSETNLGDLITDALLWYATKDGNLDVADDHIVAITNGGGIRATIKAGDITMKDINTVLPFGNTVAVVYITGDKLLEALEAATQATPEALGGFPQVAGINFSLFAGAAYDKQDETYPDGSTYYGPKTIKRVTINSINGKPFHAEDTYAVVTNDFCAAGGDVYYAFASSPKIVDIGTPMDEAVVDYIKTELNGVVGKEYEKPQGRMFINTDVTDRNWAFGAVKYVLSNGLMNGTGTTTFTPNGNTSRAMLVTVLYRLAGSPEVEGKVSETFKDCVDGSYYANAVLWASQKGIVNGYGDSFKPNNSVTRQEMAKILYGYDKVMEKTGDTATIELTYTDLSTIANWALEGVNYCTAAGYMSGSNNQFNPNGSAVRAMTAQVLMNMTVEKEAA